LIDERRKEDKMNPEAASTSFREKIRGRLDNAQADLERRRREMDQEMTEMEETKERFKQIANRLMDEVLLPTLQELAEQFENAQLESAGMVPRVRCQLRHCLRFPALANVEFGIVPSASLKEGLAVRYHAEILPVFIQFERDDEYRVAVDESPVEGVRAWAEKKVLGFIDAYLQIETHKQYQSHNFATDPVCGMQVPKPQALTHDYAGEKYYFCAQRCVDRFAAQPEEYVSVKKR
jgi:YHS domain-containing protein